MLTRIMRKVPYFKGEVGAFQLNSKNAMYRRSCIGWLGQWATPVDDGYKDQILPRYHFRKFSHKINRLRFVALGGSLSANKLARKDRHTPRNLVIGATRLLPTICRSDGTHGLRVS
jgi:hypothetical protein